MFVTRMLRWGDPEKHSYVLGCYTSIEQARFAGEVEKSWRGGKYEYEVTSHIIDQVVAQEAWEYHMQCNETYC
jgi:hypothetical protein